MAHPVLGFSKYQFKYNLSNWKIIILWFVTMPIEKLMPWFAIIRCFLLILTIPYLVNLILPIVSIKIKTLTSYCMPCLIATDFFLCQFPYLPYKLGLFSHLYDFTCGWRWKKHYEEAEHLLERGIQALQGQNEITTACAILLQSRLVSLLLDQDKETELQTTKLLKMLEVPNMDPEVLAAVMAIPRDFVKKGRPLEAFSIKNIIAELVTNTIVLVNKNSHLLLHLQLFGNELEKYGKADEAIDISKLHLEWIEKADGSISPAAAYNHAELGLKLATHKQLQEAQAHLTKSRNIMNELALKPSSKNTPIANRFIVWAKQGEIERLLGKLNEAETTLNKSLEPKSKHSRTESLLYLARVYIDKNDITKADEYFKQAIETSESSRLKAGQCYIDLGHIKLKTILSEYLNFLQKLDRNDDADKIQTKIKSIELESQKITFVHKSRRSNETNTV